MPDNLMDMASLCGSALATVITAYFWLVRSRREKPDLRFYMVAPLDGNLSSGCAAGEAECHVLVRCVVANYSMLPDTLIRMRAWLLHRDGHWMEVRIPLGDSPPFPTNIAAMHSALLSLGLVFTGKGDITGTSSASRREISLSQLSTPPKIRVEMYGLSNTPHSAEVTAERPTGSA